MERTYRVTQDEIKDAISNNVKAKALDLSLKEFGPYSSLKFTRNGRFCLFGGQRGHVGMIDLLRLRKQTEIHVKEQVRDVQTLHNQTLFAVSQKKYVYIF